MEATPDALVMLEDAARAPKVVAQVTGTPATRLPFASFRVAETVEVVEPFAARDVGDAEIEATPAVAVSGTMSTVAVFPVESVTVLAVKFARPATVAAVS